MSLEETVIALSGAVAVGSLDEAACLARRALARVCDVTPLGGLSFCGRLERGKEKTLLLEAHIDEVGFVVTAVEPSGFVRVAAVGGVDTRLLPATRVIIHGTCCVPAVFCTTPPHLNKEDKVADCVADLWLDTGLGTTVGETVAVGDYVTYSTVPAPLSGQRLCAKSLDDRCGCAVLLELAERLSGADLPVNVIFLFSDQEELGERGAKTAGFALAYDWAVALDVSFGRMPGVSAHESGEPGKGPMIGYAPVLDRGLSQQLTRLARERGIPYQKEIMSGPTSTDADVFGTAKSGCPVGLVSIPLCNMHTPAEVIDLADCRWTADLLEAFVKEGVPCVS